MKSAIAPAIAAAALSVSAAARAEVPPELSKGTRIDLGGGGDRFLRILSWNQIWMRYTELNPDSLVRGAVKESAADIAIRRSRVLFYGQLSKDVSFVTHFGINNQSATSGGFGVGADTPKKPQLFLHDVWAQYQVVEDVLSLGAGLHYWQGPTRLAGASTITMMTFDQPISNWENIEKTDQFGRQLGVYAKGKIEKLDYRLAVNDPFVTTGTPAEGRADYNPESRKVAYTGYLKYDFLDAESNALPYFAGTYIGKKKVWNVGAGFYWHPDAMAYLDGGETRTTDMLLFGVDTFFDIPAGGAGAFTGYLGATYEDAGPNYLRNIGVLNPSSGVAEGAPGSVNGAGNALPTVGTGMSYYGMVGWLLPWDLGRAGQLQPYAAARWSNFVALEDPVIVPDIGLNWFIVGHHGKLTLNYRSRPVFQPAPGREPVEATRRSELTLQAQVFL
ncbi:MAG TPA: hypothetical protein VLS89_15075 [Candidatus Nanopelagicales bacterium]|nr:hypothetical protein [Candidatus Nanopelagicales bacterium]